MARVKQKKYSLDRIPVVAVMGHVDHGKTTLLDFIRGTSVQACEVGGITQNTRAHNVDFSDQKITFIDTPGHEAFSNMRSRGAKITDIALIVVAVDDGIKPQTRESIKFAKASGVPMIVVANKIDLPGGDIAKLKNELSQNDVLVEEYGGDVQFFEISAKTGKGVDSLLDGILVQAEMLELKRNTSKYGEASAVVLESKLDSKLGSVCLVLVKSGVIEVDDYVVGSKICKLRALMNECQANIHSAEESLPVWICGFEDVIPTGEILYFSKKESIAKQIRKDLIEGVFEDEVEPELGELEETDEIDDLNLLAGLLATEQKNEEIKKLNVVVKTDSQGTLEVVESELQKLCTDEACINILSKGTGAISRSDIITAKNARGIVLGFQVGIPSSLEKIIKQEKVLVRTYQLIYDLIEELGDAVDGMLEPPEYEEEVARAEVKKVFELSNKSKIAGCVVKSGHVIKGYQVYIERDGEEIARGKITSLKRNKNEVKEVLKGSDCGIMIEPQADIQEGDDVVLFKVVKQ
jgi:translation initiation factor IF-2